MRITFILWLLIGLVVVIGIWFVSLYNNMVRHKNYLEGSWNQIDKHIKHRHSLIPNLLNTVIKYASREKAMMESVTRLRNVSKATAETTANQEQLVSNALSGLMVKIEACTDLKDDINFRNLKRQLTDVESEIQYATRHFNDAVRKYNTLIQSFPAILIAENLGFTEADFFELD